MYVRSRPYSGNSRGRHYVSKCVTRTSCISSRLSLHQKSTAEIALALQMHACDTFLTVADAGYLQSCSDVVCDVELQQVTFFCHVRVKVALPISMHLQFPPLLICNCVFRNYIFSVDPQKLM